jgi:hypothetical protein
MDRLDDLHRISRIYAPEVTSESSSSSLLLNDYHHHKDTSSSSSSSSAVVVIVPPFLKLALSLFVHLEENDLLKERMLKL